MEPLHKGHLSNVDTVLSPNNIESCTNLPLNSRHLSRQDIQLGPTGVLYREVPLYLSTSPLHPHPHPPHTVLHLQIGAKESHYLNHVGQSLHSDTDGLQTISHCTTYLLPAHCLHTYIRTYVRALCYIEMYCCGNTLPQYSCPSAPVTQLHHLLA